MPYVPGFDSDVFISYAHRNDEPFNRGEDGWVTSFIHDLTSLLQERSRDCKVWSDPALRTGEDFSAAIGQAISGSAVFLSILSPAYVDSDFCKQEVSEFRKLNHPSFNMNVGTLRRMQAILLENLALSRWPPELNGTSPYPFFDDRTERYYRPGRADGNHPYIKGLFATRKSIWDLLEKMREEKEKGIAIERPYDIAYTESGAAAPVIYLADVTDDLYDTRENLSSTLKQSGDLRVETLSDLHVHSSQVSLSVHLFGPLPGRPAEGHKYSLGRLQLEAALAAKPVRRPLVWRPRDLDLAEIKSEEYRDFLKLCENHNGIEVLRTGLEDLKTEIQTRMQPPAVATSKNTHAYSDSIVHIWHSTDKEHLSNLRLYLKSKECGISVYPFTSNSLETLQAKLDSVDGLIVPYTAETQGWAEDLVTRAFQSRKGKSRPRVFAAVELPPPSDAGFNFEHSRVVPVRGTPNGDFVGIDMFLKQLESAGGNA